MTSNPSPAPLPGASFLAAYLGHLGMPEDPTEVLNLAAYLEHEAWELQKKVDELMAAVDLLRGGVGIEPISPLGAIPENDETWAIPCHISVKDFPGTPALDLLNDGPELGCTLRGAVEIKQVGEYELRFSVLDLMRNLSTSFEIRPVSWIESVQIAEFFTYCAKQMFSIGAATEGLVLCRFCEEDLTGTGSRIPDDPLSDTLFEDGCEACRCAIRDAISHGRGVATLWTGEQIVVPEPPTN